MTSNMTCLSPRCSPVSHPSTSSPPRNVGENSSFESSRGAFFGSRTKPGIGQVRWFTGFVVRFRSGRSPSRRSSSQSAPLSGTGLATEDSFLGTRLNRPFCNRKNLSWQKYRLDDTRFDVSSAFFRCCTSPLHEQGEVEENVLQSFSNGWRKIGHKLRALLPLVLGLVAILSLPRNRAWAGEVGVVRAGAPQGQGLFASAWAGLVAGCLHTLTGPDHLAGLAPLCIGRSKLQSAAVGALWGCGHDTGQIIFGMSFLLLKDKLHIELIRTWASRIIGLSLIAIGGVGIFESQEPVIVLAEEAAGLQDSSGNPEVRQKNDSKMVTTFATGVVYGLQPDALLMILPALALPSKINGAAFLGMFLLGTILAMGSYTLFLASCSQALQKRLPGITKNLSLGSSLIAIALGLALITSEFLGLSLF